MSYLRLLSSPASPLPRVTRRLFASAAASSTPPLSSPSTSTGTTTPSRTTTTPPPSAAGPAADRGLGMVRDVLRTKGEKFYHTTADVLVTDAAREMVRHDIGSLIIVDGPSRVPVGIVTETDYLQKVIVRGASGSSLRVRDIMSEKPLAVVSPDASLSECMELMATRRIRHVPVLDHDRTKVLGMVSVGDIVKELVAAHRANAEHLQSFIQGSY